MTLRKRLQLFLPLLLLGFATARSASAATIASNNFLADNSTFSYSFATSSTQIFTFNTTSYATGGFFPVLTLFNLVSGAPINFSNTAVIGDAMITNTLGAGSYVLYLTEFPNVAINRLADGFEFASSPTITGDLCGVNGGKFINVISCTQRTSAYSLNLTTTNPVPEPPTWLLVLTPVALIAGFSRRFTA